MLDRLPRLVLNKPRGQDCEPQVDRGAGRTYTSGLHRYSPCKFNWDDSLGCARQGALGNSVYAESGGGDRMMRITVTGRHMTVREELKTYATEKTAKLERFYDRAQNAEVVFDHQAGHTICEIIVRADHHQTFVAKEQHADAHAALDASVKDLERQLSRHKEKFRNRKHPGDIEEREPLSGPALEGEGS